MPTIYHAIIRHIADAVLLLDLEDRVIDLNPVAERLVGATAAAACGQFVGELIPAAAGLLAQHRDEDDVHLTVNLSSGSPSNAYHLHLAYLYDPDGQVNGRYLTLRQHTNSQVEDNHPPLQAGEGRQDDGRWQLLAAEKSRRHEADTLREATAALTSTLDLDQLLDLILEQLDKIIAFDSASIFLFEGEYARIVAARGLPDNASAVGQLFPADDTLTAKIRREMTPTILHDARTHPAFQGWQDTNYVRGWIGVPLILRNTVIGQLTIDSRQPGIYGPIEAELALAFANQAASAIENARLYAAEQQGRELAEILRAANEALTQNLDLETVLGTLLDFLRQLIPYDSASIMRLEQNGEIHLAAARGYEQWTDSEAVSQVWFRLETNWSFRTLFQTKHGLLITDTHHSPEWNRVEQTSYVRSWLGVPLITGHEVWGFFSVDKAEAGFFTEEHLRLANTLATQTAVAIQNAQLYQDAQLYAEEQRIISMILRQLNASPDVTAVFTEIAASIKQFTNCHRVSLTLLDDGLETAVMIALDQPNETLGAGARLKTSDTAAAQNVLAGQLNVTPDLSEETHFPAEKLLHKAGYRSRINIPLQVNEQVIGSLNLTWQKPAGYASAQFPLLEQIAESLALAVERSRLFDQSNRRTAELAAVVNVSTALRKSHTVDEILLTILEIAIGVVAGIVGDVYILDPQGGELAARGCYPPDPAFIGIKMPAGLGITGHVAATGDLYIAEDLAHDPLANILPEEADRLREVKTTISLPLHAQTRVVGVMNIGLGEKRPISENKIHLLIAISEIAGSALDRALLLETLEQRVKERTQDLAQANEQLQELDRLKTKFVSDVSHELRTPITNLSLYLDLLTNADPDKQARYLSILRKQTDRLTNLIEDTLSLSQLEMGREKMEFLPVDLNLVVEQVVTAHTPRADMAGLTLVKELQTNLPLLFGEKNQVAQVVSNLLANAINYTPQGQVWVRTYAPPGDDMVCLEVADTGLGIDAEDQQHLFERFYRGKYTGQSNIPGTGLGLAIVKEIVDLHEGRIEVQSKLGVGSTFKVYFPRLR